MTNTDLHQFLRTRRSVRRFIQRLVPTSVIERILETATHAPSAHNLQPWRFCVIEDKSAKTRFGKALTKKMRLDMNAAGAPQNEIDSRTERSLRRIDEAPVIILLCRDVTAVRGDEPEEVIMAIQSVATTGLQLMLAAHAEGLGSNWICWPLYAPAVARQALILPETWEPQAMFFLGYAVEKPTLRKSINISEVIIKR